MGIWQNQVQQSEWETNFAEEGVKAHLGGN